MKLKLFFFIIFSVSLHSQNLNRNYFSTVWDKDISVFYGNEFLTKNIFKSSDNSVLKFQTIGLAAVNSGEITTVLYKTEDGNSEGLLLCFYGNYWNDAGVLYTGYGFKNLDKEKAFEFLNLIQKNLDENKDYLTKGGTNVYSGNNIYFKYNDINIIMGYSFGNLNIRMFWQTFDSSWNEGAFQKSKRRFEKKIN